MFSALHTDCRKWILFELQQTNRLWQHTFQANWRGNLLKWTQEILLSHKTVSGNGMLVSHSNWYKTVPCLSSFHFWKKSFCQCLNATHFIRTDQDFWENETQIFLSKTAFNEEWVTQTNITLHSLRMSIIITYLKETIQQHSVFCFHTCT